MLRRKPILLAAGFLLLAGCSRPVSEAYTTQTPLTTEAPATTSPPPSEPEAAAPAEPIAISGAGFELHAASPATQAAIDAAWAGVLQTLNRYLEAGVLTPLRTGGPAGDLSPLFTPLAVSQVMAVGPDRAAFIDEGLAPATDLRPHASVAKLSALIGPDGVMTVVTAALDLRLTGRIMESPVTVARRGDLVLLPEGGTWRIDAWDLTVTRTLAESVTTRTVRA